MRKKLDPLLKCQPWKVSAVFFPIEQMLSRIERDGTVDTDGMLIVFREDMHGGWYDAVAALRGLIEFHDLASKLHGTPSQTDALRKFANKLESSMPVFEQDISAVRENIRSCRKQALGLRVSQAQSILDTVRIGVEMERIGLKEAA